MAVLFVAEAEHGYASSLPVYEESRSGGRRPKTKKSQGSRWVEWGYRAVSTGTVPVHSAVIPIRVECVKSVLHSAFCSRTTHNELEKNRWVAFELIRCRSVRRVLRVARWPWQRPSSSIICSAGARRGAVDGHRPGVHGWGRWRSPIWQPRLVTSRPQGRLISLRLPWGLVLPTLMSE